MNWDANSDTVRAARLAALSVWGSRPSFTPERSRSATLPTALPRRSSRRGLIPVQEGRHALSGRLPIIVTPGLCGRRQRVYGFLTALSSLAFG